MCPNNSDNNAYCAINKLQTARRIHREVFKRTLLTRYRKQNFKMTPEIPGKKWKQ